MNPLQQPAKLGIETGGIIYRRQSDGKILNGPVFSKFDTVSLFFCHDMLLPSDSKHKSMWKAEAKGREAHDIDGRLSHNILELLYNKPTKEFILATHAEAIDIHGGLSGNVAFCNSPITLGDTPVKISQRANGIFSDMTKRADVGIIHRIVFNENYNRHGNTHLQEVNRLREELTLFQGAFEEIYKTPAGQAAAAQGRVGDLETELAEKLAQLLQLNEQNVTLRSAYEEMKGLRNQAVGEGETLVGYLRVIRQAAELGLIKLSDKSSLDVIEGQILPKQLADGTADQQELLTEFFNLLNQNREAELVAVQAQQEALMAESMADDTPILAEAQAPVREAESVAALLKKAAAPVPQPITETEIPIAQKKELTITPTGKLNGVERVAIELLGHINSGDIQPPPHALLKKIDLTVGNQYAAVLGQLNPDPTNPVAHFASDDLRTVAGQIKLAARAIYAQRKDGTLLSTGNTLFDTWVATTNDTLNAARTVTPEDPSYTPIIRRMLGGISAVPNRVIDFFANAASSAKPPRNDFPATLILDRADIEDIQPTRELTRG